MSRLLRQVMIFSREIILTSAKFTFGVKEQNHMLVEDTCNVHICRRSGSLLVNVNLPWRQA